MRLHKSTEKAVAALAPCRAPSQSTLPSCLTYSTAVLFVCSLFFGGPFSSATYQPSSATASRQNRRRNSANNSRQNCLSSSSSTTSSTWSDDRYARPRRPRRPRELPPCPSLEILMLLGL